MGARKPGQSPVRITIIGKPTAQRISGMCTEAVFVRGQEYYKQGMVKSVRVSNGFITAHVVETEKYRVKASLLLGNPRHDCTCRYDGAGICEHIVAVLLYASENLAGLPRGGTGKKVGIKGVLNGASHAELREFLESAMARDKNLRKQFMAYFGADTRRNYREEMDAAYSRAYSTDVYEARVNLGEFFDAARMKEKGGSLDEAVRIYTDISEVVAANMERIYDSSGRYDRYFFKAVRGMTDCINGQSLEHQQKRVHISYLFERAVSFDPPEFEECYQDALEGICTDRQDLEHWKSLLEPILPDRIRGNEDYAAAKLVNMQVHLLEGLEDDSLDGAYLKHYRSDPDVCLGYINHLKRSDPSKALQVAEEGMRLFPYVMIRDAAVWLYGDADPRRSELLEGLLCDTLEWRYYDALMESSGNRQETLESVIQSLRRRRNAAALVAVLLREGKYDRAISEVVASKNLDLLEAYHGDLCERYPAKYHTAYKDLLEETDVGRAKKHYKKFGEHLRKMKSVPGHEQGFEEFLASLKEEFRRRPSLLEELKSV